MSKLIAQQGYYHRGEFEVHKGNTFVGRDDNCDIMIPDGQISRRHAKISYDGQKAFLEDLESFNGTFLNWVPVEGRKPLKHLDVIQICTNVFVYNDTDEVVEDEPVEERGGRHRTTEVFTLEYLREMAHKIERNVQIVFKGKPEVVRNVILCMLADGHVLLEDAPGVGKSILAQAVAKSIHGGFKRIQFTPDMLPSDIIGISVYNESDKGFRFIPGPIFGNVILADEINRTTPRTQAALLECMNDAVVTVDGKPQVLPKPFFVMSTQNPAHHHGTYPLPEAQLDRFLMKLSIGYPDPATEHEILESQTESHPLNKITYVAKAIDIVQFTALVRGVHVALPVRDFIVNLATATRKHPALTGGVSPRGSLALMRAGQALAAYSGRRYVVPADIRELAVPTLAHRVHLKLRAQTEFEDTCEVIAEIVRSIPDDAEETQFGAPVPGRKGEVGS